MKTSLEWLIAVQLLACVPVLGAPKSVAERAAPLAELSEAFATVAAVVGPAVVQISASGYVPGSENSIGGLLSRRESTGAGVLISADGQIVTNAHVVGAAQRIRVRLSETTRGRSILRETGRTVQARILGIDLETDLALLKVDTEALPYLEFGNSDELRPGQLVLAFGSPLGLTNSVSMGVISAVARQLSPESPMIYLQTDAPINPGNSGGPLVDPIGRLIGINTLILSQSGGNEGIGFAAPSNIVRTVVEQIREHGRVRRGAIGVHAQTLTAALATALGIEHSPGVIVGDVLPDSPAAVSGLRVGDVILRLNGKTMENARQFDVNLYQRPLGATVALDVLRDGTVRPMLVPVVERPGDPVRLAELVHPETNVIAELSILALDLDDRIRGMLHPLRHDQGVVVAAEASPATADVGFAPGDVIYAVNRQRITSVEGLRRFLRDHPRDQPLAIHIERDRRLQFLELELE